MASSVYLLMNKDVPLLEFRCDRDAHGQPVFTVLHAFNAPLPFGFERNNDSIEAWLTTRRAPRNRKFIANILDKNGCNDLEGYIRFSCCVGLNDTFWVKEKGKDLSWNSVSLYRNPFNEIIAQLAFNGGTPEKVFQNIDPRKVLTTPNPEVSTDGSYAKCWIREDGNVFLIKRGSDWNGSLCFEPFSEICAYDVGRRFCQNIVPYSLDKYKGVVVSKCPLFTTEKLSYAPADSVGLLADLPSLLSYFESIGSGEQFREMMVLDALTLNPDRHLRNFGVLYDADTLEIRSMAPIFDNNISFLPHIPMEDIHRTDALIAFQNNHFDDNFNDVAMQCLTPTIEQKLSQMRPFRFSQGVEDAWKQSANPERLKSLENIVNRQLENILERRKIIVPSYDNDDYVLSSVSLVFDKKAFDDVMKKDVAPRDIDLGPFDLHFKDGSSVTVSSSIFDFNSDSDTYRIRLHHCPPSEPIRCGDISSASTLSLIVRGVPSVRLLSAKSIEFTLSNSKDMIPHVFTPKSKVVVVAPTLAKAQDKLCQRERSAKTDLGR